MDHWFRLKLKYRSGSSEEDQSKIIIVNLIKKDNVLNVS